VSVTHQQVAERSFSHSDRTKLHRTGEEDCLNETLAFTTAKTCLQSYDKVALKKKVGYIFY